MIPIESISISPDIKKQNNLIIIGLFFVITSILIFINADLYAKAANSLVPTFVRAATIFSLLFFGGITGYLFSLRNKKQTALTINRKGIVDHTNASSVGLIMWDDITAIESKTVLSSKSLLIYVKRPEKYLENTRIWKKIILKLNDRICKTPFSISLNHLEFDAGTTTALVKENYRKFKYIK
ncbi:MULTISPECIES: STM3941 family protein [Zunongwangia]|jgi:hypothetical protein|uniref:STM3941 family protein n=1 Tax=Zunongwangia TaxID=417127 RepID=UPI000C98A4AA|nr:STM3941 family protein [Zunongwangia profunda]MAG86799.1 hypothetical protein [Flavobacteriaceae bacterium]MCC4229389.1 hypothetical protein [Zunongwangia profunda]|tara:strand:- start:94 stop:639 length:546 start_codon:yes stop_codon:yes gene_type:complete